MQAEAFAGVFYLKPVFYVACAFIIFFILFGRTLAKFATAALDKRIADIKHQLEEAARLRAEAEAMLADAKAKREDALAEATAMIQGAQAEAQRLAASLAADARAAAARRERQALDRIAAAEKAVVTELRTAAIDLAADATTKVLSETLTEADDATLISHAIGTLPASMRAA